MTSRPSTVSIRAALVALILPTAGLSAGAWAQPPHQQLAPAWEQTDELMDGILSPAQHVQLNDIAYAAAVSNLCEGYSLDREKFAAGFEGLQHEDAATMSEEEQVYFQQHLMFNLGVAVGLFMAEGALDPTGFCQQAREHREDPEASHLWAS